MNSDKTLVTGLGDILSPDVINTNLNLDELERMYSNSTPRDIEDKIRSELMATARDLGLDMGFSTPRASQSPRYPDGGNTPRGSASPYPQANPYSQGSPYPQASPYPHASPTPTPMQTPPITYNRSFESLTEEQESRAHINAITAHMAPATILDVDKEHDQRLILMSEIDDLRAQLEAANVDISRVPMVSSNSSFEEIKNVRQMLRIKDDRSKYSMLANEMIMFGAHTIEDLFDGKKVWLGKYSPDMTGWHNHVQVKLRRIQCELSNLTGGVMQDYNIPPWLRIVMELFPSAVLYSRSRATQYNQPTLSSFNNMRNMGDNTN